MTSDEEKQEPRTSVPWALGQGALVALLVFVYFEVRGLTEGSTSDAVANAHRILELEQRLHIDFEGAMQDRVSHSDVVLDAANWIYIWGHWPVIVVTMVWLLRWHTDNFRRLRDAMMISGAVGMVIFARFPVAPPRLSGVGMIDTVTERSHSYRVLQPPNFTNQYAAMPSLHVGWDLLIGIAIVTSASTLLLRAVGCMLPILMMLAVTLTANHYVLDVVAGVSLVLIAHLVALALDRRRQRVRARPALVGET